MRCPQLAYLTLCSLIIFPVTVQSQSIERLANDIQTIETRLDEAVVSERKDSKLNEADEQRLEVLVAELNDLVDELKTVIGDPVITETAMPKNMLQQNRQKIDISGFGDFFYSFAHTGNSETPINIGQVELDLETGVTEHIGFVGALIYDAGRESVCLGDLYIDFGLLGNANQPFSVAGFETGGIKVGQFDVPFGIDFNVYPSIERKLVSGALVVENTHECWGDFGLQVYGESSRYSIALYGVNGFGYKNRSGQNIEMRMSTGGRIGFRLLPQVEMGTSYAGFLNLNGRKDMSLSGIDIQVQVHSVSLKAEYVEHMMGMAENDKIANTGYYCQGLYDFGKIFAVARYGAFTPDNSQEMTRTSAGMGYVFREGLEFRGEYQFNSFDEDHVFFQIVLGI